MSRLLEPLAVGELELPNRVIMAPLTRNRASMPGRVPNGLMRDYYVQRASAGLILTEATSVTPMGVGYPSTPGIWSQEQVEGWKAITDGRARGGRAHPAAALACRAHLPSDLPRRRAAGGAERHRRNRPCQPGPAAERRTRRRARSRPSEIPASSRRSAGAPRMPRPPASTASRSTAPTATCSTSSCRTAPTSAPTPTAARSRTARACMLEVDRRRGLGVGSPAGRHAPGAARRRPFDGRLRSPRHLHLSGARARQAPHRLHLRARVAGRRPPRAAAEAGVRRRLHRQRALRPGRPPRRRSPPAKRTPSRSARPSSPTPICLAGLPSARRSTRGMRRPSIRRGRRATPTIPRSPERASNGLR